MLNRGSHLVLDAVLAHDMLELIQQLAHKQQEIVWRTTLPGHDGCNVTQDAPLPQRYMPSGKNQFGWEHFLLQDTLVFSILETLLPDRVLYLDAAELSNTRIDAHVATKSKWVLGSNGWLVSKPVEDCLHYCQPDPQDDWNTHLAHLLSERTYSYRGAGQ